MSWFNITETSGGGLSKTQKTWGSMTPLLAKASAHLLASLKQCCTWECGICVSSYLQSSTRAEFSPLKLLEVTIKLTTNLASKSIITAVNCCWKHKLRPSRKAHNSAATLEVEPIFLEKPLSHSPFQSLIKGKQI